MAWNEPGGGNNKPKDPWGGGNQGPPDLDEALKKLQAKLGGLFGGGGSSSGGGATPGFSGAALGVLAVVAVLIWALRWASIRSISRSVVSYCVLASITIPCSPGLHWNPPLIDDVTPAEYHQGSFRQLPRDHAYPGRKHRRGKTLGAVCDQRSR